MCSRYARRADKRRLASQMQATLIDPEDLSLEASDEITPGQMQPIVRLDRNNSRTLSTVRWGFPFTIQGQKRLVFNTRSETVMDSRVWRPWFTNQMNSQRCIVPATAFYEWKKSGTRRAGLRHEITVKNEEIFGFAGLWGMWVNPKTFQEEPMLSIFTTAPNAAMQALHDRQPVILNPDEYEEWLAPATKPPLHLLRVFPEERMQIRPTEPETLSLFP